MLVTNGFYFSFDFTYNTNGKNIKDFVNNTSQRTRIP